MRRLIGMLVLSLLTCTGVFAQATAEISGTVKDQTGAVLPGAEIKATQTDTGIERTTISNETGSYVLPNLTLGPYRVEVALPGFRTFVQTGVVLQVNSSPVVNAVLEVGQVSEQVEVQANAAMVETRSVGVGQVVENERILELPLNGRQAGELITLAGAAVQIATTGNRSFAGTPVVVAAGGLGYGAAYSLDGIFHMDPYDGQSQPLPFPDALQEFKVESSGLSAQNGRAASVNAVTKSGTNEFHGDLFEFVRNDLFNATNAFGAVNPVTGKRVHSTLKRNQFGGTVGGPITRNKLFFFGGYQGTTLRQDPSNQRQYVPTAAMLAGDFTAVTSPACNNGRQIALRAPFVNNRIDPSQFSRAALNITAKLPQSNDPCGLITFGQIIRENDGQYVGKVDYQLAASHSMFGRYVATTSNIKHPYEIDSNLLSTNGRGFDNIAQGYTFGDTYLIGANIVNAYRLSVSRVNVQRTAAVFFAPKDVGINVFNYVPNYMTLAVTGGFQIGSTTGTPSTFRTTYYQMADDVSVVRGTHQIGFGARIALGRSNTNAPQDNNFAFNGQELGLGLADFLVGRASGFTQRDTNVLYVQQRFGAAYLQDTWKATQKLTLNYGVRWQPFLQQEITNGYGVYSFDYDRFRQGQKSTVFRNAPAGFIYPGDAAFPEGKSGFNTRWAEFSPRLGLAWDVQGDGRTSVRTSYAMSYEDLPMQWRIFPIQSPPWGNVVSLTSPAGGLENPWSTYPGGNPFPTKVGADIPFVQFGDYQSLDHNIKPITVSSWNLSLQRQVASDWLVSASYLATQTLHVWTEAPANPATYIPGNCQAGQFGLTAAGPCSSTANINQRRRLFLENPTEGRIGNLGQFDNGGTQIYHGMLLSVQRRAARGVTVNGNYTWSHCIGDERRGNQGQGFGATETYIDPNNRDSDRGNCTSDRRHIFNATAVAETPQFSGKTLRMLASGWRTSGILRKSTGGYFTVTSGLDRALTGIAGQRPLQVLESPYGDKSAKNFLNPAAFAQPATGTYGNVGFNSIVGPGTWQLDIALSRIFQLRESQRLEFRAEAYNLTNSVRLGTPGTNFNSLVTFGQITSAADPRILQFALKYVF